MNISTLKDILAVLAPIAVIVGVIIALIQLRNQSRLRQFDTVMHVYSTFGDEAFQRHFQRVLSWQYTTSQQFEKEAKPEDLVSMWVVAVLFENIGLLYKRKLVPLNLLDDLLSGPLIRAWERSEPIAIGMRVDLNLPQMWEWFELLYKEMRDRMERLATIGHA
jgi:hypothetical protein